MRSPADMHIIQIEVTNSCPHWCSNCTRFCGHYKKPFFIKPHDFKKAVDSLVDFPGMIGFMGGEPTLHPHFKELVDYYADKIKEKSKLPIFRQPVKTFSIYRNHHLGRISGFKRGLWTSLGGGYYKNFEQIQDVFGYQCINDHQNEGLHQALLITRRELGISDDEWIKLRDKCWIQNMWSASITPKGAFFCEVAAALDMLFGGPGGWPVEPGWWKRKPEDFGDQLQWCELCSAPLRVPRCEANKRTDIISPVLLDRLIKINSPKIKRGYYILFSLDDYDPSKYQGNTEKVDWYLPNEGQKKRVSDTNRSLSPRDVVVYIQNNHSKQEARLKLGRIISETEFKKLGFNDWVIVFNDDADVDQRLFNSIHDCVLNPGCLYYYFNSKRDRLLKNSEDIIRKSKFILFNRRANALIGAVDIELDKSFVQRWEKRKQVHLDSYPVMGELTGINKLINKLSFSINKISSVLLQIGQRKRPA